MKKALLKIFVCVVAICSALCVFTACGESPISFNLNFIVDNEIVKTIDTMGNEKIALPNDPQKDGYTFGGWFWDKDTWEKPFTANSLLDAPLSSDMSVYAKFTIKHEHNYTAVITAPTCTERGYTTYTCECGDSYIDDYTDELGHDFGAWIETTAPTCTTKGVETRYCSRDNTHTETREINELGHTPETEVEENRVEPKCEVKGGYDLVVYCKTCGAELSREHKEIAALTHEFTNYVSDNNATYDSDGTKTAYCNHGCGATDIITDVGTKLQSGIVFKTLTVSGNNVYGKIPNAQTEFDFLTEIETKGNVTYNVSRNLAGDDIIVSKTAEPNEGDNKYYILIYLNGELLSRYNVTIHRTPIFTVSFCTDGGTVIANQLIKEDSFATEPSSPTKAGYAFAGWDYNFDKPITENTVITAGWTANTDTKYKVEYYLQNLADDNYTLEYMDNLTGETDKQATAEIKTFEHFTHTTTSNSVESGKIKGDGSIVLKVYYTRNTYTVNISAENNNITLNEYHGQHKYGYIIPEITATVSKLGYGCNWYCDETLICTNNTLTSYQVINETNIIAKFVLKEEMSNFDFTSTATICEITGIKDKTVTEIIVPDYITKINRGAFSGCYNLESITLPFVGCIKTAPYASETTLFGFIFGDNSYTGSKATRQYYQTYVMSNNALTGPYERNTTFYIPSKLKKVTITGGNIFYGAFSCCSLLTNITIPDSITGIASYSFYYCSSLTSIIIPDGVTSIGNYAFSGCTSLTSITIPSNVTSIGSEAFRYCYKLVEVINKSGLNITRGGTYNGYVGYDALTIHNGDSKIVNKNGYLFITDNGTNYLLGYNGTETELTLPSDYNGQYYQIYQYVFNYCTSLTSVTIPDSLTSIGDNAFCNCYSLMNVIIGNGVTSIGDYAFSSCSSLTSITIPDSVTSIGGGAFNDCRGLTSVYYTGTIDQWCEISFDRDNANPLYYAEKLYINNELITSANITTATKINSYSFFNCSSLRSVTIGNGVTSIGVWAFYNCSSLRSVTIPDSVNSIGVRAFFNCSWLTSVTIGNGVMSIGDNAFIGCSRLSRIYYKGTATEWDNISISYSNEKLKSATRYYYIETKPTDTNYYYWHYYIDGVTPVIWVKGN